MRSTLAIAKKELTVFLTTPWAWVIFTFMAVVCSFFFLGALVQFQDVHESVRQLPGGWAQVPPDYQVFRNLTDGVVMNLYTPVLVVTLLAAPVLSMRLVAEERQLKTFELLMTTPTHSLEIVLGKFLGAAGTVIATLSVTLIFPIILSIIGSSESGSPLEWSTVFLGYFGLILWGVTCVTVGLFVSSLTESQMVAAFGTLAVLLAWMLIALVAPRAEGPVRSVLNYVSFDSQLQNLFRGVLDLKPIVFFTSIICLFLLLTHRSIEARRWT